MCLFDTLEKELKDSNQANLIKNTFKLTLVNEIISKECSHRSESKEEAISLILSVKDKKSLTESLKSFIKADILEGDNAYYCESCDKKVVANKRQIIKTLPNVLIVVLKRFEFNVEKMTRYKVNEYCEFPQELDMEEFTQEGQSKKDLTKEIESGKILQRRSQ